MSSRRTAPIWLAVLTLALTACGRLYELPPPQGEPVLLKPAELATTWTDADGGTVTLKPDGTFVAHDICLAISWDRVTGSGTGTWKHGTARGFSVLSLDFDVDKNGTSPFTDQFDGAPYPVDEATHIDSYAALKYGKLLKFWTRVGDPDNDYPHCTLTHPAN
ncbi:hypothetical protein [Streptomyces tritici]|uniref:hypothetical protein n=1 Tax=Streptomyces tritici TaxID=2054410 RepID=UPI003AF1185A